MTRQEKIREGIIKSLNEFRQELQKPSALINVDTLVMLQGAFADKIMADESKQGVVKKVDRELPEIPPCQAGHSRQEAYKDAQQDMLDNGYVAVEPLIKEDNNVGNKE